MGPVLGPHACTDRTRDTRVTEPRLPAPEDGRPGEGQRLTPDPPHNGGRPPPPGDSPPPPPQYAAPTGHASQGDSAGPPHPHTRAHSTWTADPDSPPRGQAVGGGGPQTPPHNGQRHPPGDALPPPPQRTTPARKGARCRAGVASPSPHRPHPGHTGRGTPAPRPRGRAARGGTAPDTRRRSQRWQATAPRGGPPTTPAARSPQRACRPRGQCRTPTLAHPRPQHVDGGPRQPAQGAGGRGRGSAWPQTPLTTPKGALAGDATPPPPQRATPARKGAVCGAGTGSPHPHRPHPGHTDRGTPTARPGGRAAGGGTAPDTRRPSQRWQATPPGDGPPPPSRQAAPTGHASQGDSAGLPHPHTRAHSTWLADPTARPVTGQSREGERLTSDTPRNGDRHPPRGRPSATPIASNASPQGCTLWDRGRVPMPALAAPRAHGSRNPDCPAQRRGGQGRGSARPQTLLTTAKGTPPRGRPSATPTASNAGPQGRTLWGRCWVPRPAPTVPGTHGSRRPGCPPQRMGGPGRDSA